MNGSPAAPDLARVRHRVEAFNDMAAIFERGFSFDGLTDQQNAEVKRVAIMCCTNAACLEMVGAGITTFEEIRVRGSSEWPVDGSDASALRAGSDHPERTILSPSPAEGGGRYRHKVRGTIYEMIGTAELQAGQPQRERAELAIYRGDDGKLWARNTGEFHDGRFERITTPTPPDTVETAIPAGCDSCGGLNLSCPDGCERDPKTGDLIGPKPTLPTDKREAIARLRKLVLLQIIEAQDGTTDISNGGWADAFAQEYEKRDPDTIQQCVDEGLITTSFNDLFESTTAVLTDAGRAILSAGLIPSDGELYT